MTDEERQQAAAAAAAESESTSLEDEAPPDIPDLDEEEVSEVVVESRLSSKPPPKPRRTSSDGIPAVRSGSIPPPPPSARRLAAAEPIVPPTPTIDVLDDVDEALSSSSPAQSAPGASSQTTSSEPPQANPQGSQSGSTPPGRPASVPPPRPASVPPPRPASVPPGRPASVPPPRPASVPPRPASVPPPASREAEEDVDVTAGSDQEEEALDTVVQNEAPDPSTAAPESDGDISVGEGTLDDEEESAALSERAESGGTVSGEPVVGSDPPAPPEQQAGALKGVTIPDDEVPTSQPKMEVAPAPPSALMAMRIISISEPERPPVTDDEDEPLEDVEAEELEEGDLATGPEGEAKAKPPPPPKRAKRPPPPRTSVDKERAVKEAQQKRKVRPWWEELFGDDFGRAIFTPKPKQIAAEVDFIEQSLGVARGGVVLDLACGSGEHAVELASRGYAVVGYDLSITMLAQAQEIAQERGQKLNFLQGDMREMAFEDTFDGVYCWSSAFGYFEEEKNINVAQRIFRALRPGGTFLLDIINRDYVAVQTPSSVWFEGDGCVCMDDAHVDWITSRLKVKRTVMLDDGRSKECNYSVRLYSLHELGKLLHDVGFLIRNASGQVATPGVFFGPNSPSIIVLAQKPKGDE